MLAGTAAMLGTATGARVLFAQDSRMRVDLRVRDPARLRRLQGDELREALLQELVITVDGAEKAVPVGLCCVRVEDGKARDVFLSRSFEVGERRRALPGDMYLPGDMFLPGDMYLPGDMFLPGDMYYPESGVEGFAADAAVRALKERRVPHGLFFVLVVSDPRMRADVPTSGTLLPTR